ncbi:MAG: aldehyde dehydrogenase family protein [Pirellulales bacterium]
MTEIYAVTGEIKHARKHLRRWMRPERVPVPMSQLGSRSWIHYESKGTALILSPWNFPINLTLGPLVSAVGGGYRF